jgi:hypothetical protein
MRLLVLEHTLAVALALPGLLALALPVGQGVSLALGLAASPLGVCGAVALGLAELQDVTDPANDSEGKALELALPDALLLAEALGLPLGEWELKGLGVETALAVAPVGGLGLAPVLKVARELALARALSLTAPVTLKVAVAQGEEVKTALAVAVCEATLLLLPVAEAAVLAVPALEGVSLGQALWQWLALGVLRLLADGEGVALLLACGLPLPPPLPPAALPDKLEVTLGEACAVGEDTTLGEALPLAHELLLAPPPVVGLALSQKLALALTLVEVVALTRELLLAPPPVVGLALSLPLALTLTLGVPPRPESLAEGETQALALR